MVLYILDGSGYQPNVNHSSLVKQGFSALIAKSTQGATGRDSAFAYNKAGAKSARLRFAAYHFLTERPAHDQAANCARMVGDKTIPVWIDLERTTGSKPTLGMALSFAAEMKKLGFHVPGIYFPHFYWSELGKPNHPRGFHLWQAMYPNNRTGLASSAFTHVPASYWAAQGGIKPALLQFSDLIKVDGYSANTWDCSAFDGTLQQLDALNGFKNWSGTTIVAEKPHPPIQDEVDKMNEKELQHAVWTVGWKEYFDEDGNKVRDVRPASDYLVDTQRHAVQINRAVDEQGKQIAALTEKIDLLLDALVRNKT
jgi:hypothetical protein